MIYKDNLKSNLIIILLSIIFSFFIIFFSKNNILWEGFFNTFNIKTLWPPFADIRSHQYFSLSIDQGYNPYSEHPNDPWNRTANYPFIWYYISKYLNLINDNFFLVFTFLMIFFYTFSFSKLSFSLYKNKPFFILSIFMFFSSSSMLAIERGNSDLILFFLIFFSCYFTNYFLKILFLSISIVLKIYPIIVSYIFINKIRDILIFILIIFLVFIFNFSEIQYFIKNTSSSYSSGFVYGIKSILNGYPKAFERIGFNISQNIIIDFVIYLSLLFLIILIFFIGLRQKKITNYSSSLSLNEKLFLCGSTIYIITFLLFSNYDYRLIFLILTLPHMAQKKNLFYDYIFLLSIIISLNSIIVFNFANTPMHFLIIGSLIHFFKVFILLYLTLNVSKIVRDNIDFLAFRIFKFLCKM